MWTIAFTDYLVWWTIGKAIEYRMLRKEKPGLHTALDKKPGLAGLQKKLAEQVEENLPGPIQ